MFQLLAINNDSDLTTSYQFYTDFNNILGSNKLVVLSKDKALSPLHLNIQLITMKEIIMLQVIKLSLLIQLIDVRTYTITSIQY
ncbi:unnamed protein product [Paramecium sonneborni]|uniref:Uncharacterized protein n=1 Tax=Paramecium sonneborni TaxID=65129 RepID=A0A8S1RXN1_9CILI|nr:unnamed protein product [Paramecium sonneborni]